jgi:RND family efflux transporter MFP subunit
MKRKFSPDFMGLQIKLTALAVVSAVLGLSGCGKKQQQKASGPPPVPNVTIAQPVQKEIVEWDSYPGHIEAVDEVEVRARVGGYLQSIHFKDGAEVQKGDLLFVIDPRPYQAELEKAQAEVLRAQTRLELAKNEFERAERLLKGKAISEEEADTRSKAISEAEAALNSAKASVETARLNLEFTRVTAPISGRIGRKMMTEGNLVNGSQPTLLTTIVSLDPIYCYFDVEEPAVLKYMALLREGKLLGGGTNQYPAELQLANENGFPHKGFIDFTDNRIDPRTGTLRMRGIFPNPGPNRALQPGFFARIRVLGTAPYRTLLVIDEAVGTDLARKFLYTLSPSNTVAFAAVKLGPLIDELRVVREGISSNDWVIVNGLMTIRPGVTVNAQKGPMTPPNPAAKISAPK